MGIKQKRFNSFRRNGFLWIGIVGMVLAVSTATYAAGPITISHALVGYTDNGPTVTLDFSLDIVNNGTAALTDAEISPAPVGPVADRLLEPISEQSSVYIGDIPALGGLTVNYTIQSTFILPEEEIDNFPIFWEIRYTDETGQAQLIIAESQPATSS